MTWWGIVKNEIGTGPINPAELNELQRERREMVETYSDVTHLPFKLYGKMKILSDLKLEKDVIRAYTLHYGSGSTAGSSWLDHIEHSEYNHDFTPMIYMDFGMGGKEKFILELEGPLVNVVDRNTPIDVRDFVTLYKQGKAYVNSDTKHILQYLIDKSEQIPFEGKGVLGGFLIKLPANKTPDFWTESSYLLVKTGRLRLLQQLKSRGLKL